MTRYFQEQRLPFIGYLCQLIEDPRFNLICVGRETLHLIILRVGLDKLVTALFQGSHVIEEIELRRQRSSLIRWK
jgi:hypothetical protein